MSLCWVAGWLSGPPRRPRPPWIVPFFPSLPFPCPSAAAGAGEPARGGSGRWGDALGVTPCVSPLSREMPLEDGDPLRPRGRQLSAVPRLTGMRDPSLRSTAAPGGSGTDVMAERREPGPALGDGDVTHGGASERAWQPEEALMTELSELVQKVVKSSSWWERHGVDISILACSFLLLPAGNPAQPLKPWWVPLPPALCWEPVGTR